MTEAMNLKPVVEALVMASDTPLNLERLCKLLEEEGGGGPSRDAVRGALDELQADYAERGVELVEVASGYRFQARSAYADRVGRLWEERKPRYSRALLETLALIAYRQPITRGEIEHVRGVAVSSNIMRILQERDWIKTVGHRDVPGRPAVYATTKEFLDYFGLKSLAELPSLAELKDFDAINADLFANIVMDEEQAASEGGENVVQAASGEEGTSSVVAETATDLETTAREQSAQIEPGASMDELPTDAADDAPPAADEHEAVAGG